MRELTSSAIPSTKEVKYFKVTVPNNQAHPSMILKKNIYMYSECNEHVSINF